MEEFKKLYDFYQAIELPCKLADLEITKEELANIIPQVLAMKDIDKNPYVITEKMLYEAFMALEEYR